MIPDKNAVLYFKKLGFGKDITLSFDRWKGDIKYKDIVALIECIWHSFEFQLSRKLRRMH